MIILVSLKPAPKSRPRLSLALPVRKSRLQCPFYWRFTSAQITPAATPSSTAENPKTCLFSMCYPLSGQNEKTDVSPLTPHRTTIVLTTTTIVSTTFSLWVMSLVRPSSTCRRQRRPR